jgi:hypothetical protein
VVEGVGQRNERSGTKNTAEEGKMGKRKKRDAWKLGGAKLEARRHKVGN